MKIMLSVVLLVLFSLQAHAISGIIRRTPQPAPAVVQPAPSPETVAAEAVEPVAGDAVSAEAVSAESTPAENAPDDIVPDEVVAEEPAIPVVPATLEEWEVYELLAKVDTAIKDKNADALGQLISDTATISLRTRVGGKTIAKSMDKLEYLMYLRNGWSLAKNYNYRRNHEKVVIEGDKATVTNDQFEAMVINGRYIKGDSHSTTVLRKEGKQLKIIVLDAFTLM